MGTCVLQLHMKQQEGPLEAPDRDKGPRAALDNAWLLQWLVSAMALSKGWRLNGLETYQTSFVFT